eukprot:3123300-Pyramimonas_sp.AAC.1
MSATPRKRCPGSPMCLGRKTFTSCVELYAETHLLAGTPYGPDLTSLYRQGGPLGEGARPAEETMAECLRVDADVGLEDKVPAVGGRPMVDDGPGLSTTCSVWSAAADCNSGDNGDPPIT